MGGWLTKVAVVEVIRHGLNMGLFWNQFILSYYHRTLASLSSLVFSSSLCFCWISLVLPLKFAQNHAADQVGLEPTPIWIVRATGGFCLCCTWLSCIIWHFKTLTSLSFLEILSLVFPFHIWLLLSSFSTHLLNIKLPKTLIFNYYFLSALFSPQKVISVRNIYPSTLWRLKINRILFFTQAILWNNCS